MTVIFLIAFRNELLKEKIENVIIDLLKQASIGRGKLAGSPWKISFYLFTSIAGQEPLLGEISAFPIL
jgi:hypothetical protein